MPNKLLKTESAASNPNQALMENSKESAQNSYSWRRLVATERRQIAQQIAESRLVYGTRLKLLTNFAEA